MHTQPTSPADNRPYRCGSTPFFLGMAAGINAILSVIITCAGCDDFATPAELSHAQILAIRAQPAAVAPGEQATLSVLVAGPEGDIVPSRVEWTLETSSPWVTVVTDSEGAVTLAAAADMPAVQEVALDVSVDLASGERLLARKYLEVGGTATDNPLITQIDVDGTPLTNGDNADDNPSGSTITAAPGQTLALSLNTAPTITEDSLISWFATIGEIDRYRLADTIWTAPDNGGQGWLYVVYRDGYGGVSWQKISVTVP